MPKTRHGFKRKVLYIEKRTLTGRHEPEQAVDGRNRKRDRLQSVIEPFPAFDRCRDSVLHLHILVSEVERGTSEQDEVQELTRQCRPQSCQYKGSLVSDS